jgi:hypothetical protein
VSLHWELWENGIDKGRKEKSNYHCLGLTKDKLQVQERIPSILINILLYTIIAH